MFLGPSRPKVTIIGPKMADFEQKFYFPGTSQQFCYHISIQSMYFTFDVSLNFTL